MKPLILITNDDGVQSRGLQSLAQIASKVGDVVIMAPDHNASGLSTSITCTRPLHVMPMGHQGSITTYACDGTPADCVKMGLEHFCPRRPSLVLSGINFGSNSSINIVYSGTMGGVIEACLNGFPAIGFSLLSHKPDADFKPGASAIKHIIQQVLQHPLPDLTALNVNIPHLPAEQIKGIKICRQAKAAWRDSMEKRTDEQGNVYFAMTGRFECLDQGTDTDEYALSQGYVSVVPISPDLTHHHSIELIKHIEQ
ncbi:MAG: 5'/3'-nucleotidase SurE [Bacteroidales bacterium]|nr:5'/3'-nucleotidase SurE [Bacteroidales bacterium]